MLLQVWLQNRGKENSREDINKTPKDVWRTAAGVCVFTFDMNVSDCLRMCRNRERGEANGRSQTLNSEIDSIKMVSNEASITGSLCGASASQSACGLNEGPDLRLYSAGRSEAISQMQLSDDRRRRRGGEVQKERPFLSLHFKPKAVSKSTVGNSGRQKIGDYYHYKLDAEIQRIWTIWARNDGFIDSLPYIELRRH